MTLSRGIQGVWFRMAVVVALRFALTVPLFL